ncbi:MAG: MBL fold metallo-hydrolase [Thermoplasmata archaeon]|nr:MBL fold metallo-hydrolase [Thermoplasmata archaeon]
MPEPSRSRAPTTVTYLGHASLLIESGGETIVTDPVFSGRIARFFTKRRVHSTFRPEELRGVAGTLISHAHHDHLDYRSLKHLDRSCPLVVPWGLGAPMRRRGFTDVRVVRAWEELTVGSWTVTAVPSRHFGGRLPLVGTSGHLGYVLSGPRCIYFAGDTGLDEHLFREIARRFPVQLAILPIAGAVFPWFRRNHMNADDALSAFQLLGASRLLPMHFETYPVSFEPAGTARRRLVQESTRRGVADRVSLLSEGASLSLD